MNAEIRAAYFAAYNAEKAPTPPEMGAFDNETSAAVQAAGWREKGGVKRSREELREQRLAAFRQAQKEWEAMALARASAAVAGYPADVVALALRPVNQDGDDGGDDYCGRETACAPP